MQLSPHFSLAELTVSDTAERLGLNNTPKGKLLDELIFTADRMEKVRDLLNGPCIVTSGFRSIEVNRAVGGVSNSDHCDAVAIDFTCPSFGTPYFTCAKLIDGNIKFDQIIHEKRKWVHISFGERMRGEVLTLMPGSRDYLKGLHK